MPRRVLKTPPTPPGEGRATDHTGSNNLEPIRGANSGVAAKHSGHKDEGSQNSGYTRQDKTESFNPVNSYPAEAGGLLRVSHGVHIPTKGGVILNNQKEGKTQNVGSF